MSTLFGARGYRSPRLARLADITAGEDGEAGRYLTDGLTLYRYTGTFTSGMGDMVELEDCCSLERMWLPIGQLRGLRTVVPAPGA